MGNTATMQKPRRKMFKYWLDLARDQESMLADYCAELRQHRRFTSTIRDALRLIRDLREQRLDVLFELFPWLNSWLEDRARAIAQSMIDKRDHGNGGGGESSVLSAQIARIEQLLIASAGHPTGALMGGYARPHPPLLPPPDEFATVAIETVAAKPDPGRTLHNFMGSLGSIATPARTRQRVAKSRPTAPNGDGIPKPLPGASIQFAAPSFDDL